MKTPHATLIGLSLIAAAIFFKDMPIRSAHALSFGDRNLECVKYGSSAFGNAACYFFTGNRLVEFITNSGSNGLDYDVTVWDWKSGKVIKKGTRIK